MGQKIKFYTDEHVAKAVIKGLRQRGVDVRTVMDAGMLTASDEVHLTFAEGEGRVIFTQDDDFLRLHAMGFKHAGIVYAPQGMSSLSINVQSKSNETNLTWPEQRCNAN